MCAGQARDRSSPLTAEELADSLLPQPRSVRALGGFFRLADGMTICHGKSLEPPEVAAVGRIRALCATRLGLHLAVRGSTSAHVEGDIIVDVAPDRREQPAGPDRLDASARAAQGYRLRVQPERVDVLGHSSAGGFYGLQTLRQILLCCGRRWPCLEVEDAPDFAARGLSYDVSRGKVPTLDTLKELADRLASLKVNHLQLYIEHTFAFAFDPDISSGSSPLTADELRQLDAYCLERRIELVPSLASFGHMGRVLSLPQYRHLAEVEATKSWSEMGWMERMHGLTIDVSNPQSRELLERMYDELLPLFSSSLVNVCCDETYDLGKGKNRRRAEQHGVGELYMEHLDFLDRLCRKHGKRLMFWGDIIKKHPDLLSRVPREAVVLNWDYAPDADYDSTALFGNAGLTTFVCPSTWSWNRVVADVNAAETNIRGHAAAGRRHGAAGLLNTEWGDEGHFNLLAGSWHPIALGAAMAWNADGPPPGVFDRAFGRLILQDDRDEIVPLLRRVAAASDLKRSWPAFCQPLAERIPEGALGAEKLAGWRALSADAAEALSRHPWATELDALDVHELALSFRLSALLAERFETSRQLAALGGVPDERLAERLLRLADACEQIIPEYEAAWLARNKPSCLHEITAVFRRRIKEARAIAGEGTKA